MTLPKRRRSDVSRILLVDRDEARRTAGQTALRLAGYELVTADGWLDAISTFAAHAPDVVIIDMEMPLDAGFETCRAIREQRGGDHVAIIAMTARDDSDGIERIYEAGATDFVVKPVQFDVLVHRLDYIRRATQAFAALRDSERRLADAQRIAKIGHWEWAVGGETVDISIEARRVLGVDEDTWTNLDALMTVVHPDDRDRVLLAIEGAVQRREPLRVEYRVRLPGEEEARVVYQEGEVGREEASGRLRLIATVQDISDRKEAERRIARLTNYDNLTGLPNYRLLKERAESLLNRVAGSAEPKQLGVLAIDPDQFKRINDSLGRERGNDLIRAYADRLCTALRCRARPGGRAPDIIGRSDIVGFIAVLPDIEDATELEVTARLLSGELAVPFEVDGQHVYVSTSFGIARFPGDGETAESLFEASTIALHEAKLEGRGSMSFYDDSLDARRSERLSMESRLRHAIDANAFQLVFQPKVRTHDREVIGAEALIRWTDDELGFVPPDVFIPVAEECGLISSIDAWVFERACLEVEWWRDNGLENLTMALNVSSAIFERVGVLDFVQETVEATGIETKLLELELTERTLMKATDASLELLHQLRAMGIRLALDDFGTGYSSLSYLTRFPIDTLKIDRCFVTDVHRERERAAIVAAIIAMSKSIDIRVVAEGVETEEELHFLFHQRCDAVQGYLFAKPLAREQFADWVRTHRKQVAISG